MAMTEDDRRELAARQRRVDETQAAATQAVRERDEFMRELYGGYRADPVDLAEVTGLRSRGQVHTIVKGARESDHRRRTARAALPDHLTVEEVHTLCGVSIWTVRRHARRGEVAAVKVDGGDWLIPRTAAIEHFGKGRA